MCQVVNDTGRVLMHIHPIQMLDDKGVRHLSKLGELAHELEIFADLRTALKMTRCLDDEEKVKVVKIKHLTLVAEKSIYDLGQEFFIKE